MKKLLALAFLFISISLSAFAVPLIEVADGNIDEFDIIDASGTKILEGFAAEKDGYLIRVNAEPIEAISPLGNLKIKENSLLAIVDTEFSSPTLYLVYGSMSLYPEVTLEEMISIYTPTSMYKINGKGEYVFYSTDDKEEFYNFGSLDAEAFNSITGQVYEVPSLYGVDMLKKNGNPFEASKEIYYANSLDTFKIYGKDIEAKPVEEVVETPEVVIEEAPAVPEMPEASVSDAYIYSDVPEAIELSVESSLYNDTPNPPSLSVESYIYSDTPEVPSLSVESNLYLDRPEKPNLSATSELIDLIPNKPEVEVSSQSIEEIAEVEEIAFTEEAPEDFEIVVEEVIVEEIEEESSSPIIAKSVLNKGFKFDMGFSSRAYLDADGNNKLSIALLPEFKINSFYFGFNLDPFAIASYKDNKSIEDWVGYSMNMIDYVRFRSLNEVIDISISREKNLDGDSVGLYSGYSHTNDRYAPKLSSQFDLNTNFFNFSLSTEDLSLGRFSSDNERNTVFGDASISFSKSYPLKINVGMVGTFTNGDAINTFDIYPEIGLYLPFVNKNNSKIGLNIGFATVMPHERYEILPKENGFMLSGTLPMEFKNFNANVGIYYSNPGTAPLSERSVHFMSLNSFGYKPELLPGAEAQLTIAAEANLALNSFGFDALVSGDLKLNSMLINKNNSLINASIYTKLGSVKLSAGIAVQNFTEKKSYWESARYYGALETENSGIKAKLSGGIYSLENKDFFLSFAASSSFGSDNESAKNAKNSLVSLELVTGFEYNFDGSTKINATPIFTLGRNNYALSLRVPAEFRFNETGKLVPNGINGKDWWNFAGNAATLEGKIYNTVINSLSLVNYIKLGGKDISRAYIVADRGDFFTDTLYTSFGADDALSLNTGFNLRNLRLNVFVGDLENPHLGEVSLGVYPINLASFSIGIDIPAEVYIKDMKNFELYFYPQISMNIPLIKEHLEVSAYAAGTLSAAYEDGTVKPSSIKLFYDFSAQDLYSTIAGAKINLSFAKFSLGIEGGIRSGLLTPDMYSVFTSTYNMKPSIDGTAHPDSYFGKLYASFETEKTSLSVGYSASDVIKLYTDPFAVEDDMFSFSAKTKISDNVALSAELYRKGFVSLFKEEADLAAIFTDANTIYSLGLIVDFGSAAIEAKLASSPIKSGVSSTNDYINIANGYDMSKGTAPTLYISTRISF